MFEPERALLVFMRAGEFGSRSGLVRSAGYRPPSFKEIIINGGGAATGVAFSLGTFFWRSKRKYPDRGSGTAIKIYYSIDSRRSAKQLDESRCAAMQMMPSPPASPSRGEENIRKGE